MIYHIRRKFFKVKLQFEVAIFNSYSYISFKELPVLFIVTCFILILILINVFSKTKRG